MEGVIIRSGEAKDVTQMAQLIKDLNVYQQFNVDSTGIEKRLLADGFTDNALYHTLVAEIVHPNGDSELIGMIGYAFTYILSCGRMANMSSFFIKQSYRSQGIGEKMYKRMLEDIFQKNCNAVAYTTLHGNQGSVNFYKRMGANEMASEYDFMLFWHFKEKLIQND